MVPRICWQLQWAPLKIVFALDVVDLYGGDVEILEKKVYDRLVVLSLDEEFDEEKVRFLQRLLGHRTSRFASTEVCICSRE